MQFLASLESFGMTVGGYILPFLFVLTVVVFFHELGHFLVARWCGVKVTTFSVGFGPELFGFNDRKGTRWRLSWIPLGGYVRFFGDDDAASTPDRAALQQLTPEERSVTLQGKSVAKRAAIVAAGPIANFILAIAIFTTVFALYGRAITTPRVESVVAGGAAERAGFQPGDIILTVDGEKIESFTDLQRIVSISAGVQLKIVVERAGQPVTLTATPELKEVADPLGSKQKIGQLGIQRSASQGYTTVEHYSLPGALVLAASETWFVVDRTVGYLAGVVTGRESADQLGGPIRVADVAAKVAEIGFTELINLAAVLSISIGLLNLLPVPMLDGGHLLFFLIEAIRGRPLSERAQDIGFRIGFVAVIALMIFATTNDITQIIRRLAPT
ncbi:MAG: RIP metalloprotease RseP [Rhizobiales bacterium]|nr:RIP metalloprotease RseP [Hyphomicrobiales bacterium]